jgi:hypothetical protein
MLFASRLLMVGRYDHVIVRARRVDMVNEDFACRDRRRAAAFSCVVGVTNGAYR